MSVIKKWLSVYNRCAQTCAVFILMYCGEMTSQHLWPRYDRHFVGMTCHNVRSKKNYRPSETMLGFFLHARSLGVLCDRCQMLHKLKRIRVGSRHFVLDWDPGRGSLLPGV